MGKDGDGPEKPEQEAWGLYAVQAPPVLVYVDITSYITSEETRRDFTK